MDIDEAVARARHHADDRAWDRARAELVTADEDGDLDPDALELLAEVAYLCGRDQLALDALARAHRSHRRVGAVEPAVRCAFWLVMLLLNRGEPAQAQGWLGRAHRLVARLPEQSVQHGYLHVPEALAALQVGQPDAARAAFDRARSVGQQHDEPDLVAFGLLGGGQARIEAGRFTRGMAMLDEVMVSVTGGEVSPIVAGIVYCGVIEACQATFDVARAGEWTAALGAWCDSQPDLVPYRGQCMIHRSEILQLQGDWPEALDAVEQARERFAQTPGQVAVGAAWYQQGELHRVRGELEAADEAYTTANRWGRRPQPGLALLRLAQGHAEVAATAIAHVVDEATGLTDRARVLPAMVEIMLAVADLDAARRAAQELAAIADEVDTAYLVALAAQATGTVLLAEDHPDRALEHLRRARAGWQDLGAPHEDAACLVLLARCCGRLGDDDTARVELATARTICADLGAAPLTTRIEAVAREHGDGRPGGLTAREVEVLREVATGKTNQGVAEALFISPKTVARHLSNIYAKLNLSSRAAATAWAFEHELV